MHFSGCECAFQRITSLSPEARLGIQVGNLTASQAYPYLLCNLFSDLHVHGGRLDVTLFCPAAAQSPQNSTLVCASIQTCKAFNRPDSGSYVP